VCFFQLQHQSYQDSDLLGALQKQRKKARAAAKLEPKPLTSVAASVAAVASVGGYPAVPVPVGAAAAAAATVAVAVAAPVAPSSAVSASRPLVLFLDSNAVFAMISARHEARVFHWENLLRLAEAGQFGSGFVDENRRVYVVLCSAVLHEMDARKEYSKKVEAEGGQFGRERFTHLSLLAKQIKAQFQLNAADPSQGFLARAKNLGGIDKGFLKTVSVSQGEMNGH
jgi:hypothetical protein